MITLILITHYFFDDFDSLLDDDIIFGIDKRVILHLIINY